MAASKPLAPTHPKPWPEAAREALAEIRAWCEHRHWLVHEESKAFSEEPWGRYELPALVVQGPTVRLRVEPRGGDIIGAEGRIDVTCFPMLTGFMLLLVDGQWRAATDEHMLLDGQGSEAEFARLVADASR